MFRAGKCYRLESRVDTAAAADPAETLVRVRSIPGKSHGLLLPAHFTQEPSSNFCAVRSHGMRPSEGMEIFMSLESKTITNSLNVYRSMTVRP